MNETSPRPPTQHFGTRQVELDTFAARFQENWSLTFPDFLTGAKLYIDGLPFGQRVALAEELAAFLRRTKDLDDDSLRAAWLALGAHAWQQGLAVRSTLRSFVELALQ